MYLPRINNKDDDDDDDDDDDVDDEDDDDTVLQLNPSSTPHSLIHSSWTEKLYNK